MILLSFSFFFIFPIVVTRSKTGKLSSVAEVDVFCSRFWSLLILQKTQNLPYFRRSKMNVIKRVYNEKYIKSRMYFFKQILSFTMSYILADCFDLMNSVWVLAIAVFNFNVRLILVNWFYQLIRTETLTTDVYEKITWNRSYSYTSSFKKRVKSEVLLNKYIRFKLF